METKIIGMRLSDYFSRGKKKKKVMTFFSIKKATFSEQSHLTLTILNLQREEVKRKKREIYKQGKNV